MLLSLTWWCKHKLFVAIENLYCMFRTCKNLDVQIINKNPVLQAWLTQILHFGRCLKLCHHQETSNGFGRVFFFFFFFNKFEYLQNIFCSKLSDLSMLFVIFYGNFSLKKTTNKTKNSPLTDPLWRVCPTYGVVIVVVVLKNTWNPHNILCSTMFKSMVHGFHMEESNGCFHYK